jgi:O-acetylhomoserine/O-acetylserine sulfhydrylase-like pyridoxal-dependent enzyme
MFRMTGSTDSYSGCTGVSRGGGLRTCGTYDANHNHDTPQLLQHQPHYDSVTARRQVFKWRVQSPYPESLVYHQDLIRMGSLSRK